MSHSFQFNIRVLTNDSQIMVANVTMVVMGRPAFCGFIAFQYTK